jgi:hypothetical protein
MEFPVSLTGFAVYSRVQSKIYGSSKSLPKGESLNFLAFTVNNLFKFSAQGSDLAPFLAM